MACTKGNCTTSIYIAHRGTDRKGRAMQSAYQLDQLNSLSFTNWFSEVRGLPGREGAQRQPGGGRQEDLP